MSKSFEQIGRYSENESQNEASKMQEKIKTGEAKSYNEAEKQIEEKNEMIEKMKDQSLLTEKEAKYLHDNEIRIEKIASNLSPSDYLNIVRKRLQKEFCLEGFINEAEGLESVQKSELKIFLFDVCNNLLTNLSDIDKLEFLNSFKEYLLGKFKEYEDRGGGRNIIYPSLEDGGNGMSIKQKIKQFESTINQFIEMMKK